MKRLNLIVLMLFAVGAIAAEGPCKGEGKNWGQFVCPGEFQGERHVFQVDVFEDLREICAVNVKLLEGNGFGTIAVWSYPKVVERGKFLDISSFNTLRDLIPSRINDVTLIVNEGITTSWPMRAIGYFTRRDGKRVSAVCEEVRE